MAELDFVKVRIEERVELIAIDNPPVNALTPKVLRELGRVLDAADDREETGGVVITGAGRNAFSAGVDMKRLSGMSLQEANDVLELGQRTLSRLEGLTKPTIAAVNGPALGGGLELALACDMRIASERARFAHPEVTIGLIPAWGGTQRLTRLIGAPRAKELIFTGNTIGAQEAEKIGLVNGVVPEGQEVRASIDLIRAIALRAAPLAVKAAKRAINEALHGVGLERGLEIEGACLRELLSTEDLREGVEAFFTKKRPIFKGR